MARNPSHFDTVRNSILAVIAVITFLGGMYVFIAAKDSQITNNTQEVQELKVVVDRIIPEVGELSKQVSLVAQSVDNNAKAIKSLQKTTETLVVNVAILEERVSHNSRKYK